MTPSTELILQSALALPEHERLELVDALLAGSDAGDGQPLNEAWLNEIQRRSAEIDAGTAILTPWPEVKRRVHERLEGRSGG